MDICAALVAEIMLIYPPPSPNPMKRSLLAPLALAAAFVFAFGSTGHAQNAATLTTVYSFSGSDGSDPIADLILGSDGNIYGSAASSGPSGYGTVFELTPAGMLTTLHAFNGTDGQEPLSPLIRNADGSFYGTNANGSLDFNDGGGGISGNGNIFLLLASGTLMDLHDFTGTDGEGTNPSHDLILAADGSLYGTTFYGGASNSATEGMGDGTIFQLTPSGTLNTLHSFTDSEGMNPYGLVGGPDGNYYGTTFTSGASGGGSFFSITPTGVFTLLHSFVSGGAEGSNPQAAPILGSDHNFYCTTGYGGSNGTGAIIRITPGGAVTTLYSFSALDSNQHNGDGWDPRARLLQASDGNFYGTAAYGGANGDGTIFRVTPSGGFTLLHTFAATDGADPEGGLIEAGSGTFYGNTNEGGSDGTIYVLKTGPFITSGTTASGQVGAAFSYLITATNSPTNFGAASLPSGLNFDATTGTISGVPLVSGNFTVGISATNASGTGSSEVLLSIAAAAPTVSPTPTPTPTPVPAPVLSSSTTAAGQVGVGFSFQIVASNAPSAYTASGLPAGLALNGVTGLVSGTPTAAGVFTAVLGAANAGGATSESVTFTIAAATITTPVITSAASASAQVGAPFAYQITATNAPTSFGTSTLPDGLSVDITTGLISGTPTAAGSFAVRLFAANAGGTSTGTLQLAITTSATQPTLAITSPPDGITVVVGQDVPLAASITDADSTVTAVNFLVNGVVVGTSAAAGPFVASAPAPAPGVYALAAVASDAAGRTFSATVHVTVVAADPNNPAPTVNLLTPINARDIASTATLTLTATADTLGLAGLDHVQILVNGEVIASFDATGKLLTSAHGGSPVRQDASSTPLSKLFGTTYQMPGLDKLLTMIVTATDKLGHTSVSPVSAFHSKVTTDRAPLVSFANATALAKVLVGSLNPVHITGSDPDATGTSFTGAVPHGPVRQDAASDAVLAQLEYWINGANVAKAVSTGTLDYSFTPPAIGKYVFHAVATDGSGLATVSDPVILEADAAPPVVTAVVSGDGFARLGAENGKVAIRRTGDLSTALSVRYKVAGSALRGVNYKAGTITGLALIPAGAAQVKVKLKPLDTPTLAAGSLTVAKVKLLPALDASYSLGTPAVAKVKIIDNE